MRRRIGLVAGTSVAGRTRVVPRPSGVVGHNAKLDGLPDRGLCPIRVGRPSIEDYSDRELVQLIEWIESDTLLRTKEQLLDEAIQLLGFQRRGKKIVAAIEQAILAGRR